MSSQVLRIIKREEGRDWEILSFVDWENAKRTEKQRKLPYLAAGVIWGDDSWK